MGRLGELEKIGDAAVWLCSDEVFSVTDESMVRRRIRHAVTAENERTESG